MFAILTTHPIQYQVPLWRELAHRGVPLEVWYLSDRGHRRGLDREFGREFSWDLDMLGGYPFRFLATYPTTPEIDTFRGTRIGSLTSLFRDQGVTALLINGWIPQAYWQAAFQAHRAGIPILLRSETNDLRKIPLLKEIVKRRLLKLLFHRVSVFLTIGAANRRFYLKYGVPENRMIPVPYCVDNERFARAAEHYRSQREELRKMWGIPRESFCFLFCGKLIAKKRVHELIRAFQILLMKHRFEGAAPLHLLIVGDGALRGRIEKIASQLTDPAGGTYVTFAGFLNQTEIVKAYTAADCLVLPSDATETWGLVVNEAMACGLPAITSDQVGCAADLIDSGMTGDVYPIGDSERLAMLLYEWSKKSGCRSAQLAVQQKIARYSLKRAADGIIDGLDFLGCRPHNQAVSRVRSLQ
jgi:glycosyltransferase involved in cell wall biosynthesis